MSEKRILMVIAPKDFRDEEFLEPYRHFTEEKNWPVTVASTQTGRAQGMLGQSWPVEQSIENLRADLFDALVVVGGMGSSAYLWGNEALLQLVRDFSRQGKVISAICLSGVVLAKANVLAGKRATVWETPESLAALEEAKAQYIKQDVVSDGNVITANGPHAAIAFAQAISTYLLQVAAK